MSTRPRAADDFDAIRARMQELSGRTYAAIPVEYGRARVDTAPHLSPGPPASLERAREALKRLAQEKGRDVALEVLRSRGYANLSSVPVGDHEGLIFQAEAAARA